MNAPKMVPKLRENQGFIDPGLQTGEAMQPALSLDMVHPSGVGFRSFVSIPSWSEPCWEWFSFLTLYHMIIYDPPPLFNINKKQNT